MRSVNHTSRMIDRARARLDAVGIRVLDTAVSLVILAVALPFLAFIAAAIKLESRGPVLYRCSRSGYRGRELQMLKFRKMRAGAAGPPLTRADDERFTRLGSFLARTKLDEIPQLWNVLIGQMSLVGPRPEDPDFVELQTHAYRTIHSVKPGITGYCQLAFAREREILAEDDVQRDYVERLLPQKVRLDLLFTSQRSFRTNVRVLSWTAFLLVTRTDVAVNRETGQLTIRRRVQEPATVHETARAA